MKSLKAFVATFMLILPFDLAIAKTKAIVTIPVANTSKPPTIVLTVDNTVRLNEVVTLKSTSNIIQKVNELDARLKSTDPIYLVMDTPGGSISAGLEMIENLRSVNRPIHTITLNAYSMGFETAQGLGTRYITRDGTLMSHKGWGFVFGEFPGQLDNRYAWVLKRSERMAKRTVERSKGKHTLKSYYALIENEFWCDGYDCINEGFADTVAVARCDKSLSGTHIETPIRWLEQTVIGLAVIEIKTKNSDCPLNTGYLEWDIYVNDKPIFGIFEKKIEASEDKEKTYGIFNVEEQQPKLSAYKILEIKNKALEKLEATKNKKVIVLP